MRSILVAVSPGELWAALTEAGELVELRIAREGGAARVGDLLLGRIVALKPELPAALVEIGAERPAFLSLSDARGLAALTEGEAVLVQVTKEARADKATNVSLRPRLAGVLLDYVPGGTIEILAPGLSEEEQRSLLASVAPLVQPGEGVRLRAPARGISAQQLADEIVALRARWHAAEAARASVRPPARLEAEAPPVAALLATLVPPLPDRIVVDDRAAFAVARAWLLRHHPDAAPRLALHMASAPLFEHEDVAAAIETALARRVPLASGGALLVEHTALAIVIDVDSGRAPQMATNLEAAHEAARQIRLRNLAGPIVIGFVAMKAGRERVAAALKQALAKDPAAPEMLGWTRLGHFELVRKRRHPALDEILFERVAAREKTALTVALEALRALARAAQAEPGRAFAVRTGPDVATCLADGAARNARLALEARLGRPIPIAAEPGRARTFAIGPADPI